MAVNMKDASSPLPCSDAMEILVLLPSYGRRASDVTEKAIVVGGQQKSPRLVKVSQNVY